jgi:hypothetical protein
VIANPLVGPKHVKDANGAFIRSASMPLYFCWDAAAQEVHKRKLRVVSVVEPVPRRDRRPGAGGHAQLAEQRSPHGNLHVAVPQWKS